MTRPPYVQGLHRLAEDTYAYLRPPGTWGFSNCGLVVAGDQALLFDTQFDVPSTRMLIEVITAAVPAVTVTTVVNSHANGDHCWGNQLFPDAQIVSSAASAHEMTQEVSPTALTALGAPSYPDAAVRDYVRRHFGCFDFTDVAITAPTKTFSGRLEVAVGDRVVELLEVGPAHTEGDVIAHVPDTGVVFAGDILFIGDHPIVWTGPVENWILACDRILGLGAAVVVPGHGPVTDRIGVEVFRSYLDFLLAQGTAAYRAGVPYWEAASKMRLPEAYASWGHPERMVISLAAVYRHLGLGEPTPLPQVLHHVAVMATSS